MTQRIKGLQRRDFLKLTGATVAGLTIAPLAGCESNLVLPKSGGVDFPFISPTDDFFIENGARGSIAGWTQPDLNASNWSLNIKGLVGSNRTVSYDEILNHPDRVTVLKTLRCVVDFNEVPGLIDTALWTGVPLRIFLDEASPDLGASKRILFTGSEGFLNNVVLDKVYGNIPADGFGPMLITHMNGEPLRPAHGFPVRLLVYDSYGFKNVKWLEEVEFTASDEGVGTYQDIGFADEGVQEVASKSTNPVENATLEAGLRQIQGFAVSGRGGITKVEVSVDGGAFEEATLLPAGPEIDGTLQAASGSPFPYVGVWVKWTFDWMAVAGDHEIRVRATDSAGNAQPDTDDTFEDGLNAAAGINVTVM